MTVSFTFAKGCNLIVLFCNISYSLKLHVTDDILSFIVSLPVHFYSQKVFTENLTWYFGTNYHLFAINDMLCASIRIASAREST